MGASGSRAEDDSAETTQPIQGGAGSSSAAEPAPAAQERVTGFDFVHVVGRGGHGEVWEGTQARLGRAVAIERLRPGKASSSRSRDTAVILRAFRHEALAAASLDHPNIVPVYDFGVAEGGEHILAMKLVRGTAWDELLRRDWEEKRPEDYLATHLPILASVCQAVAFAHSRGLIHRDLKPSQVMIGEYGETLLMDWGLAVRVDGTSGERSAGIAEVPVASMASNPAGTPAYMAPEQTSLDPSGLGVWTDIYLLGGILYQILTGNPPHLTNTAAASFERAASGVVTPAAWASGGRPVPAELEALAMDSLQNSPAHRPESVREFLSRLNDYLSGATRRRESEAISARVSIQMLERAVCDDAGYGEALSRLGEAEALWPENPAVPRLRREVQTEYAETALAHGDLTLARAICSVVEDRGIREGIQARVEDASRAVVRQSRNLRIATTAAFMLLAGIVLAGAAFSRRLEGARRKEVALRLRAPTAERAASEELVYSFGLLVGSLVDQGRIGQARAVLWQIAEGSRDWEWGVHAARAYQSLREDNFETVATSRDGRLLVSRESAHGGGTRLMLRDLESGRAIRELATGRGGLLSCRFLGAVANGELEVAVFGTQGGGELARFEYECPPRRLPTSQLEFSPDGRHLGVTNSDAAAVWDLRARRIAWKVADLPWDSITAIGFDEESSHFWFLTMVYSSCVVDLRREIPEPVFIAGPAKAGLASVASKGVVVTAGNPGNTSVCSIVTGEARSSMSIAEATTAVWASAEAELVATATGNAVDIWSLSDSSHLTRLVGHEQPASQVRFLGEGLRVLTSSGDGTTRIWNARSPTDLPLFHGQGPSLQREGRHHIAIRDSRAVVYNISTGQPTRAFDSAGVRLPSFLVDSTWELVGSIGEGGDSFVWERRTGTVKCRFQARSSVAGRGLFLPGGSRLLLPSPTGLQVFDTHSGSEVAAIFDKTFQQSTPDGGLLLFGADRRSWILRVAPWRPADGTTFSDHFRRWRLERYRDWWVRNHGLWADKVRPGLPNALGLDVEADPAQTTQQLASLAESLEPESSRRQDQLECAMVLRDRVLLQSAAEPDAPRGVPDGELDRQSRALDIAHNPSNRELVEYSALRAAAAGAVRILEGVPGEEAWSAGTSLVPAARVLGRLGEQEAAGALLKVELARLWVDGRVAPDVEDELMRRGHELPERPPALLRRPLGNVPAQGEVEDAESQARMRRAYLAAVATIPDFDRLVRARWRSGFLVGWPAIRGDYTALIQELSREVEEEIVTGMSRDIPAVEFDRMLSESDGF